MSRADSKQVLQMTSILALLNDANEAELISKFLAFKTANANPYALASKIVSFIQERNAFELAERLKAALTATTCFMELQVDLLNSCTKWPLNQLLKSEKGRLFRSPHKSNTIQHEMPQATTKRDGLL